MKLSFLLIPLAFLSCKTVKDSALTTNNQKETIISIKKEQPHNVELSINTRDPYCGGAAPRESDLNKFAVSADSYILINTTINDTSTIKSNAMGLIYLNLKIGNYEIRELYKDIPFPQFQEKNQPKVNQALLGLDPDCYKKWWAENLFKFEVTESPNTSKYAVTINRMCFTGNNPCIMFSGRLPN